MRQARGYSLTYAQQQAQAQSRARQREERNARRRISNGGNGG